MHFLHTIFGENAALTFGTLMQLTLQLQESWGKGSSQQWRNQLWRANLLQEEKEER